MPARSESETMNDELAKKWEEADKTGEAVVIGDIVVCDACDDDFTNSEAIGGMIFGSKAYCPRCTNRAMPNIVSYGEQGYIRAMCPVGSSFPDFVRQYRGPNATVQIIKAKR
jgi:hypothetical protein